MPTDTRWGSYYNLLKQLLDMKEHLKRMAYCYYSDTVEVINEDPIINVYTVMCTLNLVFYRISTVHLNLGIRKKKKYAQVAMTSL